MATDTFLKNPVLIVGTKQEVSAATIQENDLVAVTDERFYTAEEVDAIVSSTEQDIRDDMNASDSELQTQITAHAGEITAIKGDITTINDDLGDLGDQVSSIESKIPNGTTDSNQLVNKQELTDTVVDIKGDVNQADSELQSQITAQAERIAELDSEKLGNNLGAINAGKVLTVDNDGNIIAASTTETGGLVAVAHDTSLKGAGKDSDPLGVADSILEDISTTKNQITELQNSKQDITTAVNYDNITNCITEIPQDIKLELNNGTLTLNAGSKVYVPNGAGVFDAVVISTDLTRITSVGGIVFVNSTGTSVYTENLNSVYSGDSAPSSGGLWYDTANNLVKYSTNGQSWSGQYSLPIGIVSTGGGQITSIDQVFNGFGYIGSSIFALSGIKALIPDGINFDGTLKNNKAEPSSVIVRTFTSAYSGDYDVFMSGSAFGVLKGTYTYDEINNRNKDGSVDYNYAHIGTINITSSVVNQFNTKTVFHAVDYSDFENTVEELNGSILSTKTELSSSISSVDSSAVHKTGYEEIRGIKKFLTGTQWKLDAIEIGVAPETNKYATWCSVYDNEDKMISFIETDYLSNGTLSLVIGERTYINGNPVTNGLTFRTDENGNRTAVLSNNPLGSSNDTSIATTQWTKTLFLPFTGGTLTGDITIQNTEPAINMKSTTMDITSSGWAKGRNTIAWCMDKNGYESGGVYNKTENDRNVTTSIYAASRVDGDDDPPSYGYITVGVNSNGDVYATAPSTSGVGGSNEIATAGWANSKFLYVVAEQKATTANNYTWYLKYSDGWIEQGGIHHRGSAGDTVNLPIAMSNEYYELQLTAVNPTNINRYAYANTYTSTYFKCGTADDQSPNNDGDIRWYVCGYAAN